MPARLHHLVLIAALLSPLAAAREPAQPDDAGMYLQLITRMQQQGAWFASLAHINAYRQQHGSSPGLELAHADALRNTGDINAARPLYERLLRGPQRAAALHGLGLLAMQQGQRQTAIEHLRAACAMAPLRADYLGDLGYAYLQAGQLDAARAPLAQAAELTPDNGRAVANLALWQLLGGHHQAALQMMEQAQLPPATVQAVQAQARQLRQQWEPVAPPAVPSAPTPPVTQAAAVPVAVAATDSTSVRAVPPGSMLERFATSPSTDTQASIP